MADAARSQRQAALEEKKKRLEELKARRQQRTTTSLSSQDQARAKIESSANLEDYIDGLLKAPAAAPSVAATDNAAASSTHAVENGFKTGEDMNKPASATSEDKPSSTSAPAPPPAVMKPKAEMFEMATQTSDDEFPEPPGMEDLEGPRKQQQSPEEETKDSDVLPVSTDEAEILEAKVLSAEEVEKELSSEVFSSFLNSTSKKVERVLGSELLADLLVDYDGVSDAAKRAPTKASDGSKYLSSRQIYECPKWTASRDVTDMDWSPLHRELMLCGYHMRTSSFSLAQPIGSSATKVVSPDDTPSDSLAPRSGELLSDGLALVWNLAMPNRPEHIFTCGSPVTTVRFHPTEATLIIGGCQSGQVVVWDVRAGRMPVQKSVLTTTASGNSKGHTHPICAMQVIEGGAGLVTASTDGRVNFWSLANLRDPAESLQIGESVSSLSVSPDSETLVCGDDMGNIYVIQSSNSSSLGGGGGGGGGGQRSRRQVRKLDCGNEGHYGMVSSLATKTLKSTATRAGISKGFLRGSAGLLLSSGVDWTIKMWAPAYVDKPILSLMSHSYDYMSDVQWSPAHASLMATASSNGTIGLWNFSVSLEDPITGSDGIVVEPDGGSGRGLNKLKWSSDGRRMLAASADRVHVLVLSEDVVRQKGDEDTKMMNQLTSRGLLDRE